MAESNPLNVNLSRRSFISAAAVVGALHFLGAFRVPGGIKLAYADDAGNTSFVVYALSREEIPIIAFNAKDNVRTPVAGMKITLTSLYNDATVTVTTDEEGCAVANIRALDDEATEDSETFAARVRTEAECVGYRKFIELDRFVESGQHADSEGVMHNILQIPTQPNDGSAYLSCVCLDGHDIQYLNKTVALIAENDMTHTLTLQLENGGAGVDWDFFFRSSHVSWDLGTAQKVAADSNGTVTTTMQGQWLDGSHGIMDGSTVSVVFHRNTNYWPLYTLHPSLTFETRYLFVPNIHSEKYEVAPNLAAQDKSDSQSEKEKNENSWMALPDWLTFKGQSSALSIPFVPIKIFGDTEGNIGISATLVEATLYKRRNGQRQEMNIDDAFKTFDDLSSSWWDSYQDSLDKFIEEFEEANIVNDDGDIKAFGASKWTSKLDVKFTMEFLAYGKATDPKSDEYHLLVHFDSGMKFALALTYCLQRQFFVCGFPLIFGVDFSAALNASLLLGFRCNEGMQNLEWDFKDEHGSEAQSQIIIKFHAELGMSIGAGIIGIMSVCLRGYGFFDTTIDTNCDDPDEQYKTSFPHIKIQCGGHFQVTVQLLLFSKTVQLDNFNPVIIYDNWKKKTLNGEELLFGNGAMPMPNDRFGSQDSLLAAANATSTDSLTMVTEDSLRNTVEQRAVLSGIDGTPLSFVAVKETLDHSLSSTGIRDPYVVAPEIATSNFESAGLTTTSAALDAACNNLKAAAGYNPLRGIRPSKQEKLWSGVFSAPHVQIVVVGGKRYLLRLATVELNVSAQDANLYVAADKDNCLFVKATEDNTLPKLSFKQSEGLTMSGGGLAAGESVCFPSQTTDTAMARLFGFEDPADYTEEQAQELVNKLCGTDTLGTPLNSVGDTSVVRTRLTICTFDDATATWGNPRTIEFALPTTSTMYQRANSWDVDFQACAAEDGFLYIGLTSIVRPYEEIKSYEAQFERQFVTLLQVNPANAKVSYAASSISMLATRGEVYWYPRVAAYTMPLTSGGVTYASVFYFYRESGTTGGAPMVITAKFKKDTLLDYVDYHSHVPLPEMYTNLYFSHGTYDVRLTAPSGSFDSLTYFFNWSMLGESGTLVDEDTSVSVAWSYCRWRALATVSEGQVLKGVSKLSCGPITNISDRQASATWFYTVDSGGSNGGERLLRCLKCTATLPVNYQEPASDAYEETCPVGTTSDVLTFEVSQDGMRLYAVRAMEGTMPALSESETASIESGCAFRGTYSHTNSPQAELPCKEDTSVQQYQLMCAIFDQGSNTFYEFFPLADLDFPADSIIEVPGCKDRFDFILSSITDITQNMLDIYQVAVPRVVGLQMESAGCPTKFAMAGDTCRYQITMANTGNVPISGFTVTLVDSGTNKVIDTQILSNLGSLIQTDNTMLKPTYDESGIPTDTFALAEDSRDKTGILWPGITRTYQSKFIMPEWAEGRMTVQVNISDPIEVKVTTSQLSALATETSGLTADSLLAGTTLSSVDPRGRLFTTDMQADITADADRVDATYEVQQSDGSTSQSTAPKTGDSTIALLTTAAIAATAAAAAAVKGHSKMKDEQAE